VKLLCLAAVCLLAGLPLLVQAGTVCRVPEDRPTLAAAIEDLNCVEVRLAPGAYLAGFQLNRSVDIVGAGIESSYLYPTAAIDTLAVLAPHFVRLEQLTVLSPEPQLDAIRASNGATLFMNLVSVRVGSPPVDGIFEDRFEAP